jgi:hypothetical protein
MYLKEKEGSFWTFSKAKYVPLPIDSLESIPHSTL